MSIAHDEWSRAVCNLLDEAERVWRRLRRVNRERREEQLAPIKQLAMAIYEEEERQRALRGIA